MTILQQLINNFGFRLIEETNWNRIYRNEDNVLIYNIVTRLIKIKPIYKNLIK